MKNRSLARRAAALLILLAMLTVSVVSLIPITASADPVDYADDIQDFGYQTLLNANQTDETTALRAVFTIGSLDYDAVGFVFSTSNSAPEAGGVGTYSTEIVHSTITVNGNALDAPDGRYWVAVALADIPTASFEDVIYIRPFIKVGENYSYIDAAAITVCQVLTYDKTVAGESQLWNSKAPTEGPVKHRYSAGTDTYSIYKTIAGIRGTKHFFPTEDNPDGNDLWFEYSFLWNPTLSNTADARISVAAISGTSGNCELYGFYTRNYAEWNEYGGHFDMNKTFVYGSKGADGPSWASYMATASDCVLDPEPGQPIYKGSMDSTITEDSYPAIGQYGWHRIGFRLHAEAVANTTAAGKDGLKAEYTGYTELYIDGVKVWKVQTSLRGYWTGSRWSGGTYALIPNRASTFFANGKGTTDGEFAGAIEYEGVQYVDLDTHTVNMTITNIAASENAVYVAVSDVHWVCGTGFRRNVSPVADPVDRTIVLDDKGTADPSDDVTCSGKIWYVFDN